MAGEVGSSAPAWPGDRFHGRRTPPEALTRPGAHDRVRLRKAPFVEVPANSPGVHTPCAGDVRQIQVFLHSKQPYNTPLRLTTHRCMLVQMNDPQNLLDQMAERERTRTEAIRARFGETIDQIATSHDFGEASAAKRGRNPRFPYVPVIKHRAFGGHRTTQLRGLAYADRAAAVRRAQAAIDQSRRKLADDLCNPRHRALREQFGLPRCPLDAPQAPTPTKGCDQ